MKLSRHAFVRFWDVHAWLGVTGGLVLHVMFFAGGFALFYDELCAWQEPEVSAATGGPVAPLVERALAARGVHATSIDVTLPRPDRPVVEIGWTDGATGARGEARVVAATGAEIAETSHLARILFWLHFLYHPGLPWGTTAAGLFGAALLLAIVTGVLIQLKDLVRQVHQFRPDRSIRVLWSDLHKVFGVMGLPFQLMYALTGAFIGLMPLLLGAFAGPLFGGDVALASRSWRGDPPPPATGRRASALTIDELASRARAAVPGFEPEFLRIQSVDDASITASFWGAGKGHLFGRGDVVLRGTDGALLTDAVSAPPTAGAAVGRWATGLHYAWFGGLAAKVLFALLASAKICLTILTGNWIRLARRERTADLLGNRLLARLTLGVGGGIVLASAALFWANRLAPPPARPAAETWSFFGVWAGTTLLFLVRAEARRGWVGVLALSGVAFAVIPVLTLARFATLSGGDVGAWVLGLALLSTAFVLERHGRVAREVGLQAAPRMGVTAP